MKKYPNIDLSMVRRDGRTSFTAVMSNNKTKERTFFQHAGANAYYGEEYIDWEGLDVDIFYIGYILLLPSVLVVGSALMVLLNLREGVPVLRILALVAAGVFWLAGNFVYPLTAYFDNTLGRTLLNALLMVFGDPVRALGIGAASLIPFGIYMVDPSFFMGTLIFWMIAGVGIIADLQSRLFLRIFARYVEPTEETTE